MHTWIFSQSDFKSLSLKGGENKHGPRYHSKAHSCGDSEHEVPFPVAAKLLAGRCPIFKLHSYSVRPKSVFIRVFLHINVWVKRRIPLNRGTIAYGHRNFGGFSVEDVAIVIFNCASQMFWTLSDFHTLLLRSEEWQPRKQNQQNNGNAHFKEPGVVGQEVHKKLSPLAVGSTQCVAHRKGTVQ